jgi:hypothetical protein
VKGGRAARQSICKFLGLRHLGVWECINERKLLVVRPQWSVWSVVNDRATAANGDTLVGLFGRMMSLPVLAFVYTVEIFVTTMRSFQRMAAEGLNTLAGSVLPNAPSVTESATVSQPQTSGAPGIKPQISDRKESNKMGDTNLNDDMLKLVRYKILFVKRDYEVAFPEEEELVYERDRLCRLESCGIYPGPRPNQSPTSLDEP